MDPRDSLQLLQQQITRVSEILSNCLKNQTQGDSEILSNYFKNQTQGVPEIHSDYFKNQTQVFSKAKVMFSIGGRFYNGPTLSYSYMPDRVLENARNVSINLHQRLARFIKLRLFFADRWMMLSEVAFDSVPVAFNISEEETLDLSENEVVISSSDGNPLDAFETIAARKESDTYVEIIIGVLTAIMLLLLVVFVVILILNKRHKLQGSPTLLKNPFGVTINMKDLLMNLSSSNNAAASSHPTPVSQEAPGNLHTPNYATLRCSSTIEEPEEPPEVPPLPDSPTLHQSPISASSPLHYRSLQSTPAISPKSKMINLGNYFPRVATDPPNRKRYHTAPREKQRVTLWIKVAVYLYQCEQ
ncbi:hypothetical protein Zmor_005806 [Zophobas morio]|uniref:Discoidin domain-containing protein n=1 Tax=Zophobas morio TaxID=2755281 RepID=A0AA38ITK3_9CUCU|nr:hypothetical protein Zmor_005806 [Zophobas morio]